MVNFVVHFILLSP